MAPHDPLCPWKLAGHLEIPLVTLAHYQQAAPKAVAWLRSAPGQREFSAITLFYGREPLIIYNDAHPRKRQAADIAHELAHGLLMHPPKPPINVDGSRHYDDELEEEANWLGPALLVSDEAALHIAEKQMEIDAASDHYGASVQVVRMRMNVSGAARRVARRRAA
ncbi:ImmA/IrrE family metallo-endopeptidase [Methylosinus sp. RM1]|uniref:ImmA/IrrE family metallo-endopeptidase n=1 Tax=Methylosinus sp. RM1 TaxID=2583817 RepID=UPI001FEDC5D5|nr:ImmA/IrrE family metallo-endopeptidase [Methylosinus sp. RM1]